MHLERNERCPIKNFGPRDAMRWEAITWSTQDVWTSILVQTHSSCGRRSHNDETYDENQPDYSLFADFGKRRHHQISASCLCAFRGERTWSTLTTDPCPWLRMTAQTRWMDRYETSREVWTEQRLWQHVLLRVLFMRRIDPLPCVSLQDKTGVNVDIVQDRVECSTWRAGYDCRVVQQRGASSAVVNA